MPFEGSSPGRPGSPSVHTRAQGEVGLGFRVQDLGSTVDSLRQRHAQLPISMS